MRPVVLSVLEHLPNIHKHYKEQILADPELFQDVAISVKQQIWESMSVLNDFFKNYILIWRTLSFLAFFESFFLSFFSQ